jgi:hypothetical protein
MCWTFELEIEIDISLEYEVNYLKKTSTKNKVVIWNGLLKNNR